MSAKRSTLQHVVQRIADLTQSDETGYSVERILATVGERTIGALALIPALVIVTPLSGIPGLSALGGITIFLICAQQAVGRSHIWLPRFITQRKISQSKLRTFAGTAGKIARIADKIFKPRLKILLVPPIPQILTIVCMAIGLVIPAFELIPFTSSLLASIIVFFQLSLLTRDGLLVLGGVAAAGGVLGVLTWALPLW